MALQGCYACIKYMVIIFNFLFWLAGIGVLSLSIYMYVKGSQYARGADEIHSLFVSLYILMAAGSMMTILGFLGCCGALRESQCMLGSFFFLVLVILIAEIVAGVWAVLNKKQLEDLLTRQLQRIIKDEYGTNEVANKSIDAIQHDFECCGAKSPEDWIESNFFKRKVGDDTTLSKVAGALSKGTKIFSVPASCCKGDNDCHHIPIGGSQITGIYEEGCVDKIEKYLQGKLTIIAGIGIGLGVIQILGLIFSIVLCCAIRNGEGSSYHV